MPASSHPPGQGVGKVILDGGLGDDTPVMGGSLIRGIAGVCATGWR
jgi:hypothetical protein